MAVKEMIDDLKAQSQLKLDEIQADADAVKSQISKLDTIQQDIVDEKKVEFDRGFDEGVKQNSAPGDKIYSQDEMNAELQPRDSKLVEQKQTIRDLGVKVEDLQKQIEGFDVKVADARAAAVAEFKEKIVTAHEAEKAAIADAEGKMDQELK